MVLFGAQAFQEWGTGNWEMTHRAEEVEWECMLV
jgi:hypothetical protein